MTIEALATIDFSAWEEPDPNDEPGSFLEGWLRYQRHEFIRKLRDLDAASLVAWAIPPVEFSVLGLVRHMTQIEQVSLTWGLGGGERVMAYGEDDYARGSIDTIDADLLAYFNEIARADSAVAAMPSLESRGMGHGRPGSTGEDDRRVRTSRRTSPHTAVCCPRRDDPIGTERWSTGKALDENVGSTGYVWNRSPIDDVFAFSSH